MHHVQVCMYGFERTGGQTDSIHGEGDVVALEMAVKGMVALIERLSLRVAGGELEEKEGRGLRWWWLGLLFT